MSTVYSVSIEKAGCMLHLLGVGFEPWAYPLQSRNPMPITCHRAGMETKMHVTNGKILLNLP